jgi:hypothetical protein
MAIGTNLREIAPTGPEKLKAVLSATAAAMLKARGIVPHFIQLSDTVVAAINWLASNLPAPDEALQDSQSWKSYLSQDENLLGAARVLRGKDKMKGEGADWFEPWIVLVMAGDLRAAKKNKWLKWQLVVAIAFLEGAGEAFASKRLGKTQDLNIGRGSNLSQSQSVDRRTRPARVLRETDLDLKESALGIALRSSGQQLIPAFLDEAKVLDVVLAHDISKKLAPFTHRYYDICSLFASLANCVRESADGIVVMREYLMGDDVLRRVHDLGVFAAEFRKNDSPTCFLLVAALQIRILLIRQECGRAYKSLYEGWKIAAQEKDPVLRRIARMEFGKKMTELEATHSVNGDDPEVAAVFQGGHCG